MNEMNLMEAVKNDRPAGVNRYKVYFSTPISKIVYVRFYNSWEAAEKDAKKLEANNWVDVTIHRIY